QAFRSNGAVRGDLRLPAIHPFLAMSRTARGARQPADQYTRSDFAHDRRSPTQHRPHCRGPLGTRCAGPIALAARGGRPPHGGPAAMDSPAPAGLGRMGTGAWRPGRPRVAGAPLSRSRVLRDRDAAGATGVRTAGAALVAALDRTCVAPRSGPAGCGPDAVGEHGTAHVGPAADPDRAMASGAGGGRLPDVFVPWAGHLAGIAPHVPCAGLAATGA